MKSENDAGGHGFRTILVATALAGAAGYVIQALAGWGLEPEGYAAFGVFWATLYLLVGAVAGIQQEIARASRPAAASRPLGDTRRLLRFGAIAALVVASTVVASAVVWAPPVLGDDWAMALPPLVVGATAYVGFATLTGVLYGRRRWGLLAALIIADPVLRLVAVAAALTTGSRVLLEWAIVAPIPLTLALGLALILLRRQSPTAVDRSVRVLLANAARTVLGAAAMAVLISALPLFIAAGSVHESAADIGAVIFNVTVTRAPLVIPVLAFQGWLVVHFRDRSDWAAGVTRLLSAIGAAGLLLSVLAWLFVPPVLAAMFGAGYALDPWLTAGIVATSTLTAALSASGAIVVARGGHSAYLFGWATAALLTVICLFLPIDLTTRLLVALAVGPAVGLGIHIAYLVSQARNSRL